MKTISFYILTALVAFSTAAQNKKIICYFTNSAVYRQGNGQIDISSHIEPSLCTHMVYAYAGMTADGGVKSLDAYADLPDNYGKNGYGKFNQLRNFNPKMKTLLAVGGWNDQSNVYSSVAADPSKRKAFVANAVNFVKKYGFDGLSLDWQYPSRNDRENFVQLLKELRAGFDRTGLLLMGLFGAVRYRASESYIIPEIVKYLDTINLITYDFHGSWESKTGINSPLYPSYLDQGDERLLNVNETVHYWLSQGAPADKLVLGIPSSGRSFTLKNPSDNGIGASTAGAGNPGPYTNTPGSLGYNEICESFTKEVWYVHFDMEQRAHYAHRDNQWVGYDDRRSVEEKAMYIRNYGLGGAMLFSVDTDDFRGICGERYPLLKSLNRMLNRNVLKKSLA